VDQGTERFARSGLAFEDMLRRKRRRRRRRLLIPLLVGRRV
jgi:hypothetical protein